MFKNQSIKFMASLLGTEKSLDGIANYFIRFGLCLKISQSVTHAEDEYFI